MPFIGEIRLFAGNFEPSGWKFCEGQLLTIAENDALFTLIGTTYGGDGQTTFALPDMRGRVPVHQGDGRLIGEAAGIEQVTLTVQQLPVHTHAPIASNTVSTQTSPAGLLLAQSSSANLYISDVGQAALAPNTIAPVGGTQPHENLQPFLCVHFIISLFGTVPV